MKTPQLANDSEVVRKMIGDRLGRTLPYCRNPGTLAAHVFYSEQPAEQVAGILGLRLDDELLHPAHRLTLARFIVAYHGPHAAYDGLVLSARYLTFLAEMARDRIAATVDYSTTMRLITTAEPEELRIWYRLAVVENPTRYSGRQKYLHTRAVALLPNL